MASDDKKSKKGLGELRRYDDVMSRYQDEDNPLIFYGKYPNSPISNRLKLPDEDAVFIDTHSPLEPDLHEGASYLLDNERKVEARKSGLATALSNLKLNEIGKKLESKPLTEKELKRHIGGLTYPGIKNSSLQGITFHGENTISGKPEIAIINTETPTQTLAHELTHIYDPNKGKLRDRGHDATVPGNVNASGPLIQEATEDVITSLIKKGYDIDEIDTALTQEMSYPYKLEGDKGNLKPVRKYKDWNDFKSRVESELEQRLKPKNENSTKQK